MAYDLGAVVPLGTTVRDSASQPINATDITLTITLPDGSSVTPSVTNPPATTGEYSYDYPTTQPGRYAVRWTTTSPTTAFTDVFDVRSADPVALVSLADVKAHLNIPAATTTHDEELRDAVQVASEVVEGIVGSMSRRTVTETHSGDGTAKLFLRCPPVLSVTSVTVNGSALDSSGYSLGGGVLYRVSGYYDMPWLCGRNNITVTYQAGVQAIPWSVLDSVKELVRINFRPQIGGNYSVFSQGRGDDFGTGQGEIRLGFFVPNTVMQRLQPHGRGPYVA